MIEDESAFVLCRICEEQIDALQIDTHLTNCSQVFEQKKQLNTLDLEIQKLCEKAQLLHRTYQTQYSLQKSKLTRLMTPDRCSMKNSAPLRRTVVYEEEQQIDDKEHQKRDSQKSLSSKPQVKSKFSQYQSQNEASDSPEILQNIEILKEDANEQEIDEIYENQMNKTKILQNQKHQTPQPLMTISRMVSSPLSLMSGSPRSSENDVLEKMNVAKFQLNQLNLIIKYTEKIMKNQNQYSIQNDLETQVELIKLNKSKSEVQELIQLTLNLIEQRVQCIQKLIKLSKPIQNEDEKQDSNSSLQRNSITMTKSKQFNIIDFINKRQVEKELNEYPKWINRPSTITQFDQLTPENHEPKSKTFSEGIGQNDAFDIQQCLSQSESINSISDNEVQQVKQEQIFQSNDINSFKNIQELQLINQALDNEEDQKTKAYYSDGDNQPKKYSIKSKQILNVKLQDFEFIQVLGIGAFGAVWLVSKKKTNDYYAMKVIDCRNKKLSEIQDLRAEKNVFEILEGEFVVQAYYSFIQDNCLFFLLDYMKGGDFSQVLSYYGRLDENIAKFYLAELLLAIESLHKKGIIHRDLKPQNILLDSNGHLKLADFGLSEIALVKKVKDKQDGLVEMSIDPDKLPCNLSKRHIRTKTIIEFQLKQQQTIKQASIIEQKHSSGKRQHKIIGTPDYIPPEVILGKSISNFSIDLWSYGVIMYEFLVGIPPFNDETVPQVFDNIIQNKIEWPDVGDEEDQISRNAYNLIKSLLDHDFKKRIDIINIKQHPFFNGIDWQNIRQEEAPIIPIRDLEAIEPEEVDQNKKLNEEAKMKKMLNTVERSHDGSTQDEVNTQLKQIANLTRIDLLAKLSKIDADNVIQKRGSIKLGIINNKQFL